MKREISVRSGNPLFNLIIALSVVIIFVSLAVKAVRWAVS